MPLAIAELLDLAARPDQADAAMSSVRATMHRASEQGAGGDQDATPLSSAGSARTGDLGPQHDQARKLDAGLFRGTALAPMETALGGLGVEAIVVGGCCELNTTAHRLIIDIGAQLGVRAATASGEDANQCVALETTRVRQRVANEIWSNYHDYVCARIKFADPTPDKQRTNEDEAVSDAAKQAEQAQRYTIQAYLHRTRQPLELGV